jgi:type 1 fimbria pilin
MTTKNFNAKKVLMSTVAAVVFSFVFTTSANANSPENNQKANLEVRVKGSANDGKNNVGIRVKGSANGDKSNVGIRVKGSQQNTEDDSNFVTILLQTFGVRVK